MSDMSRKEAIEVLKDIVSKPMLYSNHIISACRVALASLETDEAYQLEYESTTKNDLGVDCISRVQAQTEIEMNASRYTIAKERGGMGQVEWSDQLIKVSDAVDIIRNLPPVTPQEPRKGHWIIDTHKIRACGKKNETHDYSVHCDKCNYAWDYTTDKEGSLVSNFCPNCGADMREVEE